MFDPYLPQETLDYIVDLLHDERETLKECCLVSKSWIPRARKHLFAGIKFGSVGNLESWKKTFPNPPDSPAYHTLTLTIGCTQAVTTEDAEPGGWIPTFSRVVRLELSISRIDPINPSGMEAILAPYHKFSPALKSLRIESKFLSYPPIFNLVRSLPFLEALALVGCCEPSVSSNVRHDSGESDIRGGSGERSKHTGENRCKASLFLYLVQVFIYGVGNWK